MKAEDTLVTNLLEGAKQFIMPIFQRDYSCREQGSTQS
jgi:hypothetical protein